MYKIFFAFLPFLIACNSASTIKTNEQASAADTTQTPITPKENTLPQEENKPQLQAIKWSGIKEMTDETFKSQVLASSSLTLVDFNATWCGPCQKLKPALAKLVKEYDGKINFASVDVDQCPETARYYEASSIPYLVFIQNAQKGNTTIGLQPYESLKQMIDNELAVK